MYVCIYLTKDDPNELHDGGDGSLQQCSCIFLYVSGKKTNQIIDPDANIQNKVVQGLQRQSAKKSK